MVTLLAIYFTSIFPTKAAVPVNPDTLTFIHVTDIHVCNLTGYHPFFVEKRQHFDKNAETFSDFLKTVPEKYNSDFVVVTGDNVDYYESETAQGKMLDTQVEQYARLLEVSEIPVFLTLGNHDISSYSMTSDITYIGNQINAEEARAVWMRNVPCFKEGTYYSRIFKIDTTTFRFIFLDDSYNATEEVSDGVMPFIVDQYQLRWLDAQLKSSPSDVEIIFMHFPLPYGTVVNGNIATESTAVYSSKSKYYNMLSVLEKNSSTRIILAGHKHINFINDYILPDGDKLTQVLTAAFGYNTAAWRVIKVTGNKILVSFPGSSKTELAIPVR